METLKPIRGELRMALDAAIAKTGETPALVRARRMLLVLINTEPALLEHWLHKHYQRMS